MIPLIRTNNLSALAALGLFCGRANVPVVNSWCVTTTNETNSRPRWFSQAWCDRAERRSRFGITPQGHAGPTKKPRIGSWLPRHQITEMTNNTT